LVASASDLEFAFWALPHTVLAVIEPWVGLAPSVEQIRVLGEIRVLASTPLDLCVGSKIRVAIGDRRNGRKCHSNSFDHVLLIVLQQKE
jgi:hypothetical protein